MNDLNNSQGQGKCVVTSVSRALACTYPFLFDHKFLQMPRFYKLLQVVLQHTALLGSMTFLSMVSAIQALIPSSWVPTHLSRPPKVRLILNTLKDLIDRLLKCRINSLGCIKSILGTLGSLLVLC